MTDLDDSYTFEEQFLDAARGNDVAAMREILTVASSADFNINAKDPMSGATALHMAAANGHEETVLFLLQEATPSPEYLTNNNGNTPLHWALQNGHWNVSKQLLLLASDKIDVLVKNTFGKSCLSEAMNHRTNSTFDMSNVTENESVSTTPSSELNSHTEDHVETESLPIDIKLSPKQQLIAEVITLILEHPSAAALEEE